MIRKQAGQATLIMLVILLAWATATMVISEKIFYFQQVQRLQLAADTGATTGGVWEARTYNLIAAMNEGILVALTVYIVAWAIELILIACSETVVCSVILAAIEDLLQEIRDKAIDTAEALSEFERQIVKITPALILQQSVQVAMDNGADGALPYPVIPESLGGSHDNESTLTFHTEDGGMTAIIEHVMGELPGFASKGLKMAPTGNQIDPLILDDDFRPRMKFGILAWKKYPGKKIPIIKTAQATPYMPGVEEGEEDLFEMSWKTKMVPVNFTEDIGIGEFNMENLQQLMDAIPSVENF